MHLTFEKVTCAIAATTRRAGASWTDAYLDALSRRAARALERGALPDAEACCLYVLKKNPAQGRALACVGMIAARRGEWTEAVRSLERAAAGGFVSDRLYLELAAARQALGDLGGAHESLSEALRLAPDDPRVLARQGDLSFARGDLSNAAAFASRALERDSGLAAAHRTLGKVHLRRGDLAVAQGFLQRAAELVDSDPAAWSELGSVRAALSQLNEARECFERALALDPHSAELHVSLGDIYFAARHSADARSCYGEALRIAPDNARALSRLGAATAHVGDAAEAERLLLRAHDIAPGHLEPLTTLGLLHQEAGRVDQALECYRRAIAIDPICVEAHVYAGLSHLYRGEFGQGWEELEWRLRLPSLQQLREVDRPLWRGEDLSGCTILLQREPGLSDHIQFLRYAPMVASRGARVIVETFPQLQGLVARMAGVDRVVTAGDAVSRAGSGVNWRCPILSLAHRFETRPASVPSSVPYLAGDPAGAEAWHARLQRLPAGTKIGCSWSEISAPSGESGDAPVLELDALRGGTDAVFINVEPQRPGAESRAISAGRSLIDWSADIRDLTDTADLVSAVDLVIGPPGPTTHLAGAMGKPTWVLLNPLRRADWRWMGDNNSCAWYPTARVFRQPAGGDWAGLMRSVASALAARASGDSRG
ncbi:MAG: tetratricopeptide repeat protein [Gemmatimonadota bacterium]